MPDKRKRLLVIGSGGREHAIVWKLRQSKNAGKIFCAPGNAGIAQIAECIPCPATDIAGLVEIAIEKAIDYTIVGMDDPLVMGIVDEFEARGLKIFGPNKKAAEIEGSKVFAKNFMKRNNIPTADFEVFDDYNEALRYTESQAHPLVIKTDGLAAGKGAVISESFEESRDTLRDMMLERKFGSSGEKVVIEKFMRGREVSMLAFCDGKTIIPMADAQDYKKALDGDIGLNTGGMGAISPSRYYSAELACECMEKIFKPTAAALRREGRPFKGVLYFGLMLTGNGVKVIEYNCRFGDPEAQVILPRLDGDLLEIMLACTDGYLGESDGDLDCLSGGLNVTCGLNKKNKINIKWKENAACCVILASGGYPGGYQIGRVITGLDAGKDGAAISIDDCDYNEIDSFYGNKSVVFHAGTKFDENHFVTAGGRVLGVTAEGATIDAAIKNAYAAVNTIGFEGVYYRKDIGL